MAERRMFTQKIVESDAFTEMPASAQALYFHLNMAADDDGMVNSPKKIARAINATEKDLDLLVEKRFLIRFSSGVVAVKHWLMHNSIKKDRYKPTEYQEERSQLYVKENKAYTDNPEHPEIIRPEPDQNACGSSLEPEWSTSGTKLEPEWNQNGAQMEPQDRLGKDSSSLGEDINNFKRESISRARTREDDEKNDSENEFIPPTLEEVTAYCEERHSPVNPKTFFDYYQAGQWIDSRGSPMKNWKQRVIAWESDENHGSRKPQKNKKGGGKPRTFTPTEFD